MPKITSLPVLTAIDEDDLLVVVDDVAGTPITKGISQANLLQLEYGQIYVTGGGGTQTPGTSFVLMTQWGSNGFSTAGVTPDQANDKLILVETGIYVVLLQMSFSGALSEPFEGRIYWNGGAQPQGTFRRKLGTGGDVGSASLMCLVDATVASQDLDVRIKSDIAGKAFVLVEGQLLTIRIGPT